MRILKKTKKELNNSTGEKFFGAYLPVERHEYITLYTESQGVTKTTILQEMVNMWIDHTVANFTTSDLITGLLTKIKNQAAVLKNTRNFNPSEFKFRLQKELLRKGISEEIVMKIITKIDKKL